MHELKFFELAVRESNCPRFDTADEHAAVKVMGGIGMALEAQHKDGFVQQGLLFLDNFRGSAEEEILLLNEQLCIDENTDSPGSAYRVCGVIAAIRQLMDDIKLVDRGVFCQLLSQDWDERHAVEVEG